jgi:hypothetical protein
MNKKDLLNEIAGVPRVLEEWIDLFSTVVYNEIIDMSKGWDEEATGQMENPETGEVEDVTAYKSKRTIDGKSVMNKIVELSNSSDLREFIKSKTFQEFPLYQPEVNITTMGMPQFYFNKILEDGNGSVGLNARVSNPLDMKLKNLGKTKVYSGIDFTFEPILPSNVTEGISPELGKIIMEGIKPTVAHELLHSYQSFKQLEKGREGHFGPETLLNALAQNPLIQDEILHDWNDFLNIVYLHLSFEVNARVNQVYYELKDRNISNQEDFLRELKKTSAWGEMQRLKTFDALEYIKNFQLPNFYDLDGFTRLMLKMDMSRKGLSPTDKEKTLKGLVDIWDKVIQIGSQGFEQKFGVKIPMSKVPEKAKENPYYFFKFFEKRFHKNAKSFERKLYKLASILINQDGVVKTERKNQK